MVVRGGTDKEHPYFITEKELRLTKKKKNVSLRFMAGLNYLSDFLRKIIFFYFKLFLRA